MSKYNLFRMVGKMMIGCVSSRQVPSYSTKIYRFHIYEKYASSHSHNNKISKESFSTKQVMLGYMIHEKRNQLANDLPSIS